MEKNYVLMDFRKLKEIARFYLRDNWKKVTIGVALYMILGTYIPQAIDQFFPMANPMAGQQLGTFAGQNFVVQDGPLYMAGSIYQFLLSGPIKLGFVAFMLTFFRTRKSDYTLVMDGFSSYGKAFMMFVVISIKTFLWGLLFVIPGVMAAFSYSQAYYIMMDHPEYTVSQCINESKHIMYGNRMSYFMLSVSFIGWYFLSSIPATLFAQSGLLGGTAQVAVSFVLDIPYFFVMTYLSVAQTAFYEILSGKLVVDERY